MKKLALVCLVVAAAACGKKGSDKPKPIDLGSSGFTVDVPEGWEIDSPMKGFYDFKHQHGAPQIMESEMAVGNVDDAVKGQCEGRGEVQKGTLPGGGWWLTCKGESKMIKGVTTTQIVVRVPKDDKSSFDCHLETDQDPAPVLELCKSIKKK
jgi:hypothetical protein